MFEDLPALNTLIVPIGGGGLISGMATVAKAMNSHCEVIGVEVDASNAFQQSVRAGKLVEIVPGATLADGLGGNPDPETITFAMIQRLVDRIVTVSEGDLAAAIVGLVEAEHLIAEGAGAAATATLVGKRVDVGGRQVGVVVSGANIDRARLQSLL
jgi:threonine dehydratase